MTGAGEILLVSTYELGRQPHGLASAFAALAAAGFFPATLDVGQESLGGEAAMAALTRARLVAISAPLHTALRLGARVAERVRALGGERTVCFYGLYAPLHADWLARAFGAVALGPEYEAELVALARGERSSVAAPAIPTRRPSYVVPVRDGLAALASYVKLDDGERLVVAGAVEGSRGCLHMCRHCPLPPIYGGRFFAVPVEVALADAQRQLDAGARHISFTDPDFLNGPRHALALARGLHALDATVTFDATIKVEHLLRHRALLAELRALGCIFVVSAFESLSERVLTLLDKGHTAADAHTAIALLRGAGISVRPTFVPFTPLSTLEDFLALCRFVRDEELEEEVDPVQLSIRLLVPPGSLLADHADTAPLLGPLDEAALAYSWAHPDPRMDVLQQRVSALVEETADAALAPGVIFARIHALAAALAGEPAPAEAAPRPRRRVPRLTEPWFC